MEVRASPGPVLAWTWAPDEFLVADRVLVDGELQDNAHEHQAPLACCAAVEPEHELVQVAGKVLTVHCSLMGA